MYVDTGIFSEIAAAIYAGDNDKACEQLNLLRAISGEEAAEVIMRARRAVTPLPAPRPLAKAISLPAIGVDPRAHFGGPAADSPRIRSFGA
ncbi:hypothetical protein [Novosphingobium sp. fls2-241-R2A-195]|uniref:hypothetical protein n=1 Tax=Novosphingobium sp. fls2-241-R2A-195 TaxID=3040296 RepID=UPI002550815D|nr:hypothetical protein [Novosphingobium sp. fls2-241-R2A-195]